MIDDSTLKKIESKLTLRWPRLSFAVLSWTETGVDISFDTFATEAQEKQIRKYVQKFMGLEYPNYQFKIERLPF